jgi:hypothetical protein
MMQHAIHTAPDFYAVVCAHPHRLPGNPRAGCPRDPRARNAHAHDASAHGHPPLAPRPSSPLAPDRDLFRAGLVSAAQAALDELPGATFYQMQLEIGAPPTRVNGHLTVHYTNREETALDAIFFHLFPNLLGGRIAVTDVRVDGTAVAVDDSGGVLRVPLVAPLPPGAQVTLTMAFQTDVPRDSDRNYGILVYADNVLTLAHFYPMTAVYDATGWNVDAPPPYGDVTYADSSFYLVELTADAGQVVVASGVAVDAQTNGGRQTITYAGGPQRDFYLALSPDYEVVSASVGETVINSYAPAALLDGARVALDTAAAALEIFAARFGPYPYTELDLVATPTLALGVEYPGIIANSRRLYNLQAAPFGLPNVVILESTTAHEVGHQWFYNLVGNDQVDEPWLDESLTQYATWRYYLDRYGPEAADGFRASLEARWARVDMAEIPIGQPVAAYDGAAYSGIIYGRGAFFFEALAERMGPETFDAFLRAYTTTYRWEIADTAAFQALAETTCACELSDLFAEWVFTK